MANTLNFASETQTPDNHHTAQSVWCFRNDPWVYYQTYVKNNLEKPSVIRHQTDMLYKYELLLGSSSFDEKFDQNAPINPSTKKPYGDDTQKFAEWSKMVKHDGKIPVHPSSANAAHTAFQWAVSQMEDGFARTLGGILAPGGKSGLQETALIDSSYCYAHVDHVTNDGRVCAVRMVRSLDHIKETEFCNELAFTVAFWRTVLSESTVRHNLRDIAYAIMAEYDSPYRVAVFEVDLDKWTAEVFKSVHDLNQRFNSDSTSAWASPHHEPKEKI